MWEGFSVGDGDILEKTYHNRHHDPRWLVLDQAHTTVCVLDVSCLVQSCLKDVRASISKHYSQSYELCYDARIVFDCDQITHNLDVKCVCVFSFAECFIFVLILV